MAINGLSTHIATRARSIDFVALGMLLPNPDPILKARGQDVRVYRDMLHDALIGGCVRRRKSAVKTLDWGLDRAQASSRVAKAVQTMLDGLDVERIIGQMLDATLFGYQPMEVLWQEQDGLAGVADVLAKPPEWFCFDADNQLRWKTRDAPVFGELLPDFKFLLPRQDPTYQNPYGFADLSMCFWPLVFKKGGLRFWLAFAEKFGSAFSVGKLPRGAAPGERATMLDSLEKLIQDGVVTIPDDGSIELLEMAGKSASADLYERLVLHCRSEISIALLGQNQTTEASANKASSVAGLEVTRDLRDGDAELVAAAFNRLIDWFCTRNFGAQPTPVFSLWDQKDQDTLQASRDQSNHKAGARFSNAYFMRAYGYQEGDLLPESTTQATASNSASAHLLKDLAGDAPGFAEAASVAPAVSDPVAQLSNELASAAAPALAGWIAQMQSLVDKADSLNALQDAMVQAFGALDSAVLVKLMAAAFALAELKGIDDARNGR